MNVCPKLLVAMALLVGCTGGNGKAKVLDQWKLDGKTPRQVTATELTVKAGERYVGDDDCTNFILQGQALADSSAEAVIRFHDDDKEGGYEMRVHGGSIDGTRKTGSLSSVRNLYRTSVTDGEWFGFSIAVRGKNISITVDSTYVVCYTEPAHPYRTAEHARQLLGHGRVALVGIKGMVRFRNLTLTKLAADATNPSDTLPPIDEQTDGAIRLQQQNFPVIDYHVHLKGGLTAGWAHAKEMNYGINYGVAINLGEGGVGTMLPDEASALVYCKRMRPQPFLKGAQGEGRRWINWFSPQTLSKFDYLFTDAMTIVDKGRICRIYKPEEVHLDGRTPEQYMDMIVNQIVKILTNEPVDIYANPTFLPQFMQADYDKYWTDGRINRVLDVLERYGIALEINSRYKIPSYKIVCMAKQRGLKFTFGTNNENPDFGRSEYAIGAVKACGLVPSDIWFPTMSRKSSRKAVDYNHFGSIR